MTSRLWAGLLQPGYAAVRRGTAEQPETPFPGGHVLKEADLPPIARNEAPHGQARSSATRRHGCGPTAVSGSATRRLPIGCRVPLFDPTARRRRLSTSHRARSEPAEPG